MKWHTLLKRTVLKSGKKYGLVCCPCRSTFVASLLKNPLQHMLTLACNSQTRQSFLKITLQNEALQVFACAFENYAQQKTTQRICAKTVAR